MRRNAHSTPFSPTIAQNCRMPRARNSESLVISSSFLLPRAAPEESARLGRVSADGSGRVQQRQQHYQLGLSARCGGIKTSSAREIAASITRLVRSETRDLVGRPCVPTPVAPLNNTTQPYVCTYACECPRESPCESSAKCAA